MFERLRQANTDRTQGEWRAGIYYAYSKINDGSDPSWNAPNRIPQGRCALCAQKKRPCRTRRTVDGVNYHVNRTNTSWHMITSAKTHRQITGNYEYEEGGVCSTKQDAEFIALCTSETEGVPELLRQLDAKDRLLAEAREATQAIDGELSAFHWTEHCPARYITNGPSHGDASCRNVAAAGGEVSALCRECWIEALCARALLDKLGE